MMMGPFCNAFIGQHDVLRVTCHRTLFSRIQGSSVRPILAWSRPDDSLFHLVGHGRFGQLKRRHPACQRHQWTGWRIWQTRGRRRIGPRCCDRTSWARNCAACVTRERSAALSSTATRASSLSYSSDKTVRLWDAETCEATEIVLRHQAAVEGAVFNGDENVDPDLFRRQDGAVVGC